MLLHAWKVHRHEDLQQVSHEEYHQTSEESPSVLPQRCYYCIMTFPCFNKFNCDIIKTVGFL